MLILCAIIVIYFDFFKINVDKIILNNLLKLTPMRNFYGDVI